MRCLLCTLAFVLLIGCRSQTTAMTNPFLAPNRVPPPATRTLLPGTAQPYYPGDPVPNMPIIGRPPIGATTPTYAPPATGVVPPGGWNSSQYNVPGNVLPTNVPPMGNLGSVAVPADQYNLRFAQTAPLIQPPVVPIQQAIIQPRIPLPPIPQPRVSPYPNQLVTYQQAPMPQQSFVQQSVPVGPQRQVRIRAISSNNLPTNNLPTNNGQAIGSVRSGDGFRPQGSGRIQ